MVAAERLWRAAAQASLLARGSQKGRRACRRHLGLARHAAPVHPARHPRQPCHGAGRRPGADRAAGVPVDRSGDGGRAIHPLRAGRGHACVIDGDTFKLGDRKIRIIGIDAPETHPARCDEEARLGEAATARLQQLLNQGPFTMAAPAYGGKDRYGRDLRVITRQGPDGAEQSIASEMRASGLAHRYLGGFKSGWCS
jgi:micrococcal nuclease